MIGSNFCFDKSKGYTPSPLVFPLSPQAGHVCGDSVDLVNGEPTGTVRVSLGYMSTLHDAQVLLSFMKTCFVDTLTQVNNCCLTNRSTKQILYVLNGLLASFLSLIGSFLPHSTDRGRCSLYSTQESTRATLD